MTDAVNQTSNSAPVIDLFALFATKKESEIQGVETTLPGCGSTLFRIARAGNLNAAYSLKAQELFRKHKKVLDSNSPESRELNNFVMAELYAETVLLGWAGNINLNGVATPYSKDAARTLLALPDFRELVEKVATTKDLFLVVAANDDDQKN